MTEGLDLHLGVDKTAGFVERALETALREAIRSGRLHAGARLPGSRSLAADLGISRGTVVQATTCPRRSVSGCPRSAGPWGWLRFRRCLPAGSGTGGRGARPMSTRARR
jgi:DNA-binding transcriptional MocR family regulator